MRITALALLLSISATPALAQSMNINVDQSRPIKLSADATGIVIGNAGIADVIVHEPRVLLVLGKTVGKTSVLVVGAKGKVLYSGDIKVNASEERNIVNIQKGTSISSALCEDKCISVTSTETTSDEAQKVYNAARVRDSFTSGK